MDISKEISKNNVLLVVVDESRYEDYIKDVWNSLSDQKMKICYVCMNKPYKYVIDDLNSKKIDIDNFFFIDILSSYYKKQRGTKNCTFIPSPSDFKAMTTALSEAVTKKKCKIVVFDTLTTFLIYQRNFPILKFTYDLLKGELKNKAKKVLIAIRGGNLMEHERWQLINDVKMFADTFISMEGSENYTSDGNNYIL